MSYILEALKKSERERQQGQPPDLYTVHGEAPAFRSAARRRPRLLLWAGLCTLLAALGGFYLWYSGSATAISPAAPGGRTEAGTPATRPSAPVETDTAAEVAGQQPTEQTAIPAASPTVDPPVEPATETGAETAGEPTTEAAGVIAAEPAANTTVKLTATPVTKYSATGQTSNRADLPPLRFSGHTYSEEKSRRMIIVNNRIVREGEWIDTNIRLQEITWEGVIIDHHGVQISLKTQEN